MTEGNIFSMFTTSGGGGTPILLMGVRGVHLSQVSMGGGYPHLRSGQGEHPHPRSGWELPPSCQGGTSHPRSRQEGYPILFGGYPIPDQDGGTPISRMGVPSPAQVSGQDGGGTPNQDSIACTCCAPGDMPLAFTRTFLSY